MTCCRVVQFSVPVSVQGRVAVSGIDSLLQGQPDVVPGNNPGYNVKALTLPAFKQERILFQCNQ